MAITRTSHRLAAWGDFDRVCEIYVHPAVVPNLGFDPMSREDFRPIYRDLLASGAFHVVELEGAVAAYKAARQAGRSSPVVTLGPLAVEVSAAGAPGLLLAGDAAGFVDPMTGDGLRFALRGGELAAEAALYELETGFPAHHRLLAARTREFSGKWRINRALRSLVASPQAVSLAATVAGRWSTPVEWLIGMAGDVSLARHLRSNRLHPAV